MALISLADIQNYANNIDTIGDKTGSLYNVLTEIRGLTVTKATGAGANSNITVTGITTDDNLLSVLEFTGGGTLSGITDRTSTSSITSAGNIQCTQSTASNAVLIIWYNKS